MAQQRKKLARLRCLGLDSRSQRSSAKLRLGSWIVVQECPMPSGCFRLASSRHCPRTYDDVVPLDWKPVFLFGRFDVTRGEKEALNFVVSAMDSL